MAEPTTTIKGTGRTFTPSFGADGQLNGMQASAPHPTERVVTPAIAQRLSQVTEPAYPNGNAPVFAEALAKFDGAQAAAPTTPSNEWKR